MVFFPYRYQSELYKAYATGHVTPVAFQHTLNFILHPDWSGPHLSSCSLPANTGSPFVPLPNSAFLPLDLFSAQNVVPHLYLASSYSSTQKSLLCHPLLPRVVLPTSHSVLTLFS